MYGASVPRPRSRFLPLLLARWVWTLPTNLVGHTVGSLACRCLNQRLKGPAGTAWLYLLPQGSWLRWVGAAAIGHVVLANRSFVSGNRGRWVLAHEMSHTRQHDWLGPAYLPLHALFQVTSIALTRVRPLPGFSALHAYNPLERVLLHVPFDVLLESEETLSSGDPRVLNAFGVRQ